MGRRTVSSGVSNSRRGPRTYVLAHRTLLGHAGLSGWSRSGPQAVCETPRRPSSAADSTAAGSLAAAAAGSPAAARATPSAVDVAGGRAARSIPANRSNRRCSTVSGPRLVAGGLTLRLRGAAVRCDLPKPVP